MRLVLMTLLAAAITAPAVPALAQERERERERELAPRVRVWVDGDEVSGRVAPFMQRRARLGVVVSLDARDTDARGAFIQSVTPGGPADKAGIRSGDLITRLNGTSLTGAPGRTVQEGESLPGVRLIELAAKLTPNDTVTVEYLRGDARRTTRLVTGDEPLLAMGDGENVFRFRMGDEDRVFTLPRLRMEGLPERERLELLREPALAMAFPGTALGDLEVAPMNADLGWYFGTGEGVLVTRAPAGGSLGLKAGDVVLSVDGRKPSSPGSLLRILRSYDRGESFRLEIMRQKQRQTITGKLESRDWE